MRAGVHGEGQMSTSGRMVRNSGGVLLNLKCTQNAEGEESGQKFRSGCQKSRERMRPPRNSELETASLEGRQGRRIRMKA